MTAYSLPDDLRQEIIAAEDFPGTPIPENQLMHVEELRRQFIQIHGNDGILDAEWFSVGVTDSTLIRPREKIHHAY